MPHLASSQSPIWTATSRSPDHYSSIVRIIDLLRPVGNIHLTTGHYQAREHAPLIPKLSHQPQEGTFVMFRQKPEWARKIAACDDDAFLPYPMPGLERCHLDPVETRLT